MLEVFDFSVGYTKEQFLFKNISFKLLPGQIIGIQGPNGCGKSSFIKGIINQVPYKQGKIYLNGKEITNCETSKIFKIAKIGYLNQRNRVFDNLTVAEHIKLHLIYSRKNVLPDNDHFKMLNKVIFKKENFLASTLSGGEQLILCLMCLDIINPDFLLLDEPSDSLDLIHFEILNELLKSWRNLNKGILLIEQNTLLLQKLSNIFLTIN